VTNFPATNGTNAFSPSLTVERAATLQSLTNCVYAAKYYQLGLQSAPTNADLLNGYAWLLATCTDDSVRNGTNAVRLAKQACELSGWKTWYNVGTLAAACAEAGDFDDATNYESMAIGMAGIDNSSKQMEKRRLELFRAHRPSHEDPPQNALGNIRFQ
jgi:Tfp pilus assembly protein PilF